MKSKTLCKTETRMSEIYSQSMRIHGDLESYKDIEVELSNQLTKLVVLVLGLS